MANYLVRFTEPEAAELVQRAAADGVSVAAIIRKDMGLEPLERGGVREGAGRPKPKPAKKAKRTVKK